MTLQALKSPDLLNNKELLSALNVSADKSALADRALEVLTSSKDKELEQKYFPVFSAYKEENNTDGMERALKGHAPPRWTAPRPP